MQGYQFGHIETWSRQGATRSNGKVSTTRKNGQIAWTTAQIFDEAERIPRACDHVEKPDLTPMIVEGTCANFQELRKAHDAATHVVQSFPYTDRKTGKKSTRNRKLRVDAHTLYTSICSLPALSADAKNDPALMKQCLRVFDAFFAFERARIEDCGGEVAMAVIHTDERHIHIHLFALHRTRGSVNTLHPGNAATDARREQDRVQGAARKMQASEGKRLYCDAMRRWQDAFYEAVSRPAGLVRYGPRMARLTRTDWQRRMKEAEAAAETEMNNAYVKKQTRLLREAAESADELWAISVEKSAEAEAKQKAAEAAAMTLAQERKDIEFLRKKATQTAEQNTRREQDILRREQDVCAAEKLLKSERQKVSVSQQKVVEDAQEAGAIIATAKLIATGDIEPDEIDAALERDRRADHPKHAPMLAKMRAVPKAALHVAGIFGDALSLMRRKAKIEANAELEREQRQLIKGLKAVGSVVAIASRLIKTFVPPNQQDQERDKLKETLKDVAQAKVHMERSRDKAPDRDDTR